MQNKHDLKTRALEIAASPHSFAGQDISAVIHEILERNVKAERMTAIAVPIIAEYSESLRGGIEINGKLSDDPADLNVILDIETMELWLRHAKDLLCSNGVAE